MESPAFPKFLSYRISASIIDKINTRFQKLMMSRNDIRNAHAS